MAKQISSCVGGVVKKVSKVPIAIGGVVKQAKKGIAGVGGVVKEFYVDDPNFVLYDGTSLQNTSNGVSWNTSDKILNYACSAGDMESKTLIIKVKSTVTSHQLKIHANYSGGGMMRWYGSDGSISSYNSEVLSTWTAGTEYLFDGEYIHKSDVGYNFQFSFQSWVNSTLTDLNFSDYIEYMAFKA